MTLLKKLRVPEKALICKGLGLLFLLAFTPSGCDHFKEKARNLKGTDNHKEERKIMITTATEELKPEIDGRADNPAPGNLKTATFALG